MLRLDITAIPIRESKCGSSHIFLFQSEEPDGALYTLYKSYTHWDHCPNTHTYTSYGQVLEKLLPPYSLLLGSPHSPCCEIGQNASAVPPGRSQACGTWRASVTVTPGPRHSPLTGTQWRAACRQTRAGTDNIVNRAEWQTGLSGQRGSAAQRLENIFSSIFRHFSPFKHRKFHFAIFHLTGSISQGVCFWYTGMKSFAFYSGVWITGKYPHPSLSSKPSFLI